MASPTTQPTFADILREKMTISPSGTSENQTITAPEMTPFTTESLLHLLHSGPPTKHRGYKKTGPAKKKTATPQPQPIETRTPVSALSVAAQLALAHLDLASAQDISLPEVKRAYRRQARRLHPDLNPNAAKEAFAALKEAQDIILGELQVLARAAAKTAA